jgi:Raf kinase inhibitor-like YbhB/YbcL family protein
MSFTLSSRAFTPSAAIPSRHTCDGANLSPALAWSGAPEGTRTFALMLDDPDCPGGTFTHWLLCDLPADHSALAEGQRPGGAGTPGTNDFGRIGYGGPCPPKGHGGHHYHFRLYALSRPLGLERGFSRADLEAALTGLVLGTAALVGVYERPR